MSWENESPMFFTAGTLLRCSTGAVAAVLRADPMAPAADTTASVAVVKTLATWKRE